MEGVISIGDGRNSPFWKGRWLNRASPKEMDPNLYKAARFKIRNIHLELTNQNWFKNLSSIASSTLLESSLCCT
jgi:hypothetical protein